MNYGNLLSRAWTIIWEHKFLILLGVLVALSGGGGGGSSGANMAFNQQGGEAPQMPQLPQMPDMRAIGPIIAVVAIIAIAGVVVLALAFWVVSTVARGGLIAGVSTVDGGGASSFSQAWSAGWRKGWRLLGIAILPAIPAFLLGAVVLVLAIAAGGLSYFVGEDLVGVPFAGVGVVAALLSCILVPLAVILALLQTFANRACMLEDLGVFGAYRRGVQVLLENIGPALILFLIQIAIGLGIAIVGFLPGIVATVCCLLWPLLILVRGAISAYFSTVWTLAWRRWTGLSPAFEGAVMAGEEEAMV